MSFPLDESQGKNRCPRTLPGGAELRASEVITGVRLPGEVLAPLPERLLQSLSAISRRRQLPIYFSGGVVRDWLLGLSPADFDITVPGQALDVAADLAKALGAAYVPLSPAEGVARVVWRYAQSPPMSDRDPAQSSRAGEDVCIDISQFREGTTNLEDDLRRRDFSVNAMAVGFDALGLALADGGLVIDPLDGRIDLRRGVLRLAHPQALGADPLRMLRAYRFRARFDWVIERETEDAIASSLPLLGHVSGERIAGELEAILACEPCHPTIKQMAEIGLLFQLFPELAPGVGLCQPSSHHLDVFDHSLETLRQIERILHEPEVFFLPQAGTSGDDVQVTPPLRGSLSPQQSPDWRAEMSTYLQTPRQKVRLKYAALFHDLGKTTTCAEKGGRLTFHNHDEAGVALLTGIADRLRWSNEDTRRISQLVQQHMWPFHLHNARVRTGITPKAVLKLVKAAGEDLLGLFLLVMADSLAGQGPGKPPGMEEAVAGLFFEVYRTYQQRLKPILETPLLTGRDLIESLHLTPGPLFKKILDALLEERAVDPEMTKARALAWAAEYAGRLGG